MSSVNLCGDQVKKDINDMKCSMLDLSRLIESWEEISPPFRARMVESVIARLMLIVERNNGN